MSYARRATPRKTLSALRPPLAGFPFFAHADVFPLQVDAAVYSRVNAWWLADASFLVYGDADFIEAAIAASPLARQGFELQWLGTRENNRGMILSSDTALVVVFRGTRLEVHSLLDRAEIFILNQDDLWIDSQFLPTVCRVGGQVHRGFLTAYAEVGAQLDAIVAGKRPAQRLWLTGHSLGAALATVAAAHFERAAVQGLYTYGCPRVGDAHFVGVLPAHAYFRFVHGDDWVCTLPPELLGYRHGGVMRHVPGPSRRPWLDELARGLGGLASAARTLARQLHLDTGELPIQIAGLADHAPIYYATGLWNELLDHSHTGS
ncbi:MAG: lipase family protein [Pirellulaceae bacterium]|jgi:hypothetical protein|nr:lipase family protein [Pirellulaceae bacterium]